MPQDAFTLRYLCEELNSVFSGGKVNKIIQPNQDTVVLTIYTGRGTKRLLLSVNPANPRIGVTMDNYESPSVAPNFCMLLRKHLLSATIEHISLVGFDRIVMVELQPSEEFFDCEKQVLYVELMGRYSNIILTEKEKVLGANRGINFFDNGVRPLICGKQYVLPPNGDKKEPWDSELINIFDKSLHDIKNAILSNVQGLAKSTVEEIIYEYTNKNEKIFANELFKFLLDFINNSCKKPCVSIKNGKINDVFVFPYNSEETEFIFFDTLYQAEEYYFSNKLQNKKREELFQRLSAVVNTAEKKLKKRLLAISARQKEALKADENQLMGELILANIYKIKQGDEKVILENYYNQSLIEIVLDRNLSPSKNAENYYKKYNKQKRALEMLLPQKEQAESEQQYIFSIKEELSLAENIEELFCVKEELVACGILKEQGSPKKKKKEEKPYRLYEIDGFTLKFGRNNIENDELTLSAKSDDVWVHSKDYHSSHGIIERGGREIPFYVIQKAAEICAYYSKAREGGKSEVVYTERKHVKKPKKSKAGFFIYTDYKAISVVPNKSCEYLK